MSRKKVVKYDLKRGAATLRLPMDDRDSGAETIGEYLILLAQSVWDQEESFSGKRPFGNSGWQFDVLQALAQNEAVTVTYFEGTDEIEEYDSAEANFLIDEAFATMLAQWT